MIGTLGSAYLATGKNPTLREVGLMQLQATTDMNQALLMACEAAQ